MSDRKPLDCGDDWRRRWLVFSKSWGRLHRVSEIDYEDDETIGGIGTTLCGRSGYLTMPGLLSRLGLPRCEVCCRLTGVPLGDGAPANEDLDERPRP